MSSAVLSPHTTALNVPPDGPPARPRRAAAVGQSSGRQRNSTSPVSTNASFTSSMSTRSNRRASHSGSSHDPSPEKKSPGSSTGSRRSKRNQPVLDASPPLPEPPALGLHISHDPEEGEGEPELDMLDSITINGQSETASAANSTSDRAPSEKSVTPEKVEAPATERRLKLFVGSGGGHAQKRKAEDDLSAPPPPQALPAEGGAETPAPPIVIAALPRESKNEGEIREAEVLEEKKRVVRKRRKWLKKGQVDPDDHVAVAQQKEKHKMIDEAIANLDRQETMLLDGTHPTMLALWDELDRRRALNHERLKARLEVAEQDLKKMHEHALQQARFNWLARRNTLADEMLLVNLRKTRQLTTEKDQLKRSPSRTYARDTRGGGGWHVHNKDLLSNKQQPLVEVLVGGQKRQRRDVSPHLSGLNSSEIESDLVKLKLMRDPNLRSPSPLPEKTGVKRPAPYAPSPIQSREPFAPPQRRASAAVKKDPIPDPSPSGGLRVDLRHALATYDRYDQPRLHQSPIASSSRQAPNSMASSTRPPSFSMAPSSRSAMPANRPPNDGYDHSRDRTYDRHLPPLSSSSSVPSPVPSYSDGNDPRYRTDTRLPPPRREPWVPPFPGIPGDYTYRINPRY